MSTSSFLRLHPYLIAPISVDLVHPSELVLCFLSFREPLLSLEPDRKPTVLPVFSFWQAFHAEVKIDGISLWVRPEMHGEWSFPAVGGLLFESICGVRFLLSQAQGWESI